MMEWAIDRAREEGCYLIQLATHKSRTDAHRFYERLGFRTRTTVSFVAAVRP